MTRLAFVLVVAAAASVLAGGAPTSTTTSTLSSTSTTTLPGCIAGATYDSILCRIDELASDVSAADLGRLKDGIAGALAKARKQVVKAQGAGGKTAKTQLKKAAKSLDTFRHKLDSNNAHHLIQKETRDDFRSRAADIAKDIGTLRGTL